MSSGFKGRREDKRLVTGAGRYTSDWNFPRQLYAAFLRSERPHAEIASLGVESARSSPGVVAVFTGEDARGANLKAPPSYVTYPGRGGQQIRTPVRYALACERVRFVGENVAMVIATSPLAAADAAEAIEVEYRDLPAVVDVDDALVDGAPQVHADIPGNLYFDFDYGDEARVNEAMARAAHVTRIKLDSQRVVGNPLEPRSCAAVYESESDSYDVYSASQGLGLLRDALSIFSGVPKEKLRCHAHDVGGGFGIRSSAYPEYALLMLAAKRTGRPVKWIGSRAETFMSDYHGRAIRLEGELALDGNGSFLAIRANLICDLGAYLSEPGALISTRTPSETVVGAYTIPVAYGRHRLVATTTTPVTAYRGAGRPQIAYLVERLVDQAALETGIDRIELRRRNFIPRKAFPYKTPTTTYDSADFRGMLEEALVHADWEGFEARRMQTLGRGKLRGIGCGVFIEPSGGSMSPKDQAAIKFGGDGKPILYTLSGSTGQGHETVFPEIVAAVLGIAAEQVTLRASDPLGPPLVASGTIGSRSTLMHGSALFAGAREVVRKGMALAAEELEVADADVEFAEGEYRIRGTDRRVKLLDLARKYAGRQPHPLDTIGEAATARAYPSGAHVAEVEVDPDTGETEVLSYVAVDDCGRVINQVLLEGQLHGGIAQGAGQVLGENCIYDRASGQLLSGSFIDYFMPRADMMGTPRLVDRSIPSPTNLLGAKGAGEAGTTGSIATLMNAFADALRPAGVHHIDMPLTPNRVWEAIRRVR